MKLLISHLCLAAAVVCGADYCLRISGVPWLPLLTPVFFLLACWLHFTAVCLWGAAACFTLAFHPLIQRTGDSTLMMAVMLCGVVCLIFACCAFTAARQRET